MKKVLAVLIVLFVVAASGFAQFSVGAKLGGAFGFHSWNSDIEDLTGEEPDSKFNFTFGAFGGYAFNEKLSLQVELDFMLNQGGEVSSEDIEYNSLDIPVLVKYAFLQNPLVVGVAVGPQISIPLGDIKVASEDIGADGITFGAVAGLYAGYPLGPGRIIGDLRFLFDFNQLKASESGVDADVLARRALIFTVGYEFSF
jgi:hypothetical protein